MTGRLTSTTLVARGISSSLGSLVIIAIVAMVVAGISVAGPRASTNVLQQDLRYRLSTTSSGVRDLQAATAVSGYTNLGQPLPVAASVKELPAFLASVRTGMPNALRSITAPGRYVGRDDGPDDHGIAASGPPNALPRTFYNYSLEADPELRSDAALVSGSWPGKVNVSSTAPIQLVTSAAAARTLGWRVGQVQDLSLGGSQPARAVKLVGTIRPRDPNSDYWQLDPSRAQASKITSVDGDSVSYFGTVWLDAASWSQLGVGDAFPGDTLVTWFPVSSGTLTVDQVAALGGDLQRFVSKPRTLGHGQANLQIRFGTNLDTVIEAYVGTAAAGNAILTVIESGPIGTSAALLLLAALSFVERRRRATDLLRSRGASGSAFRGQVGLQVASATIPGALAGAVIAVLATGGAFGSQPWVVAALVGILPPVFAGATAGSAPIVLGRGGVARPGRWRWVIDAILVLLAILAVVILLQRGLGGEATGLSTDPLLVALPLLVSAGACAIVLRVVPLLLRVLGRAIRGGPGVVGLVGRANSARAGARFLPVFAVLTGLSVSIFASSILTTEETGIRAAAVEQSGADISISGSPMSEAIVKKLRALPGVAQLAAVNSRGGALLDGQSQEIAIYTVNASALVDVESVLPADQQLFRLLGQKLNGKSVVYGGGFASALHDTSHFSDSTSPSVATIRVTQTPPKFIGAVPWLLLDSSDVPTGIHLSSQISAVLIRVTPGTNQAVLQRQILGVTGNAETVRVADTQVRTLTDAPIVGGLEALALAAIILSLVLCVLALVLALVLGTRERIHLLGRLRALGFSRRQGTGLVGWEIGPMTVIGIVVGSAVGFGLPILFLSVVDLSTFIGSDQPPEFEFSAGLVGATILAFALCAVLAVVITSALTARRQRSEILRESGVE